MLRIIQKLNDVKAAVVALDEVSLGASPHFSDMAASQDRHREQANLRVVPRREGSKSGGRHATVHDRQNSDRWQEASTAAGLA